MTSELTIAVPRGALMGEALDLLDAAGIDTAPLRQSNRRLFFPEAGLITMRPSDVPTYVEHGVADVGIVGKDVLMEQAGRNVHELADLSFGRCVMVFAAPAGTQPATEELQRRLGTVRIATSYPQITERYFNETGRQVELIEVKGSVELAAVAGLAEGIVDLTATGATLRENGLEIREEIATCTARLIANPASYRIKSVAVDQLCKRLAEAVANAG